MADKPWFGRTVVIIDDSKAVRGELRRAFESLGLKVVGEAPNGVAGLELVRDLRPEVVSLDVIMPEMNGIECFKKIKASYPDTKCLMVSWLAGEPKVLESLKAVIPPYAFQTKPVTAPALAARLDLIYDPSQYTPSKAVESAEPALEDQVAFKVS